MPGVQDLLPITWELPVGKNTVTGAGLSAHDIYELCRLYPALGTMLGITFETKKAMSPADLISQLPEAAWHMIAISTGEADKKSLKATMDACRKLSLVTQVKLVRNVMRSTIGEEGVGPFVEMVEEIAAIMGTKSAAAEPSASDSPISSPAAVVIDLPRGLPGRKRRAS